MQLTKTKMHKQKSPEMDKNIDIVLMPSYIKLGVLNAKQDLVQEKILIAEKTNDSSTLSYYKRVDEDLDHMIEQTIHSIDKHRAKIDSILFAA